VVGGGRLLGRLDVDAVECLAGQIVQ
jgi:hypothetical protein